MLDRLQTILVLQPVFSLKGGTPVNQVYREEKKFLINIEEFRKLAHHLEQFLIEDEHNGALGYHVRSLYFDTAYDNDYFEKLDGVELRRKIRLRIYDPDNNFALLEMKQKQGPYQLKRSLRMSRSDAEQLILGDYTPLLHYKEDFAAECYALMQMQLYRPKTIVEYHRKAFVGKENKIRITFDNQIVSTESDWNIFAKDLNMNPVLDPFQVVLEVKFNGFLLDYMRDLISNVQKSELSVSKYMLARQASYKYNVL